MLDDFTYNQKRWLGFLTAVLAVSLLFNRGIDLAEERRNELFEEELRIHDAALAEYTRAVESDSEVYPTFSYLFNRKDGEPIQDIELDEDLLNKTMRLVSSYDHSLLRGFRVLAPDDEEEKNFYVYADIVAFSDVLEPHYKNSMFKVHTEDDEIVDITEEMTYTYNAGGL